MATSKITFYRTELTPDRNAWIEDLHEYLTTKGIITYSADNFQYQKIAINKTITIAADQEKVSDQSLGNYCELEQDNRSFYFFITGVSWTSQKAVKVSLSLDTINTFGEDLEFTDKTAIVRQHEDRLLATRKKDSRIAVKKVYRNIDRQSENLATPKELVDSEKFIDDKADENWFLIYRTRNDLSPTDIANPIECLLTAQNSLLIQKAGSNPDNQVIHGKDLSADTYYYVTAIDSPEGGFSNSGTTSNMHRFSASSVESDSFKAFRYHRSSGSDGISIDELYYSKTPTGYWNYSRVKTVSANAMLLSKVRNIYKTKDIITGLNDILRISSKFNASIGITSDLETAALKDIDKTDSKLMKIIRLPYCPIEVYINNDSEWVFPENWELTVEGFMRLKDGDLSTEFLNKIGEINLDDKFTFYTKTDPTIAKDKNNESKLLHSDFYTYKAIYDNFAKDFKLEDIKITSPATAIPVKIPVEFKATNTINSKFAFKFDRHQAGRLGYTIRDTEDYQDYLIVSRNNEETIFSNDYLNYIRNGYNYDKKARTQAAIGTGITAALGLGQLGANFGAQRLAANKEWNSTYGKYAVDLSGGANKKAFLSSTTSPFLTAAAISAGFNAANAAVSGVMSYISSTDAIERKKLELSQQATNVSGADDVDLLQYYSKNRLLLNSYDTEEVAKNKIFNLFYYAGYAHENQEIPNLDSRYWFNYVQCSPVFKQENTSVYSDYLDDIKVRFEKGVTKFHHHPEIKDSWDINQEKENWETKLLDTSYLPITNEGVGISNVQKSGTDTITWTNDRMLDPEVQKIRFEYFTSGGDILSAETNTQNQISIKLPNIAIDQPVRYQRINIYNEDFNSAFKIID